MNNTATLFFAHSFRKRGGHLMNLKLYAKNLAREIKKTFDDSVKKVFGGKKNKRKHSEKDDEDDE